MLRRPFPRWHCQHSTISCAKPIRRRASLRGSLADDSRRPTAERTRASWFPIPISFVTPKDVRGSWATRLVRIAEPSVEAAALIETARSFAMQEILRDTGTGEAHRLR